MYINIPGREAIESIYEQAMREDQFARGLVEGMLRFSNEMLTFYVQRGEVYPPEFIETRNAQEQAYADKRRAAGEVARACRQIIEAAGIADATLPPYRFSGDE